MKRGVTRRSSRGEQSTDSGSQKQSEAQKTAKWASSDVEESKDTGIQGIVAIRDPQNVCGGPKMGVWAEVGHFTSRVKAGNVRFVEFSQQEMQKMEKER
jgi:hypothetical protein